MSFDVPEAFPGVTENDYFYFYEIQPEQRRSAQPIRGTALAVVPQDGAARRFYPQATTSGRFGPVSDPNIESDYRPAVQDCYVYASGNATAGTELLTLGSAAISPDGHRVRELSMSLPQPGVYGFCYTSGGIWTVLPQPVVVHGAKAFGFFKNDIFETPLTFADGDVLTTGSRFGINGMGFGLVPGDAFTMGLPGQCPGPEIYPVPTPAPVPRNAWVNQTTFKQPPTLQIETAGQYDVCYRYTGPGMITPKWRKLTSVTVFTPGTSTAPSPLSSPSPFPTIIGALSPSPTEGGVATGVLGAAEWFASQPSGIMFLMLALPILLCCCCLLLCILYRRRRRRQEQTELVWVDPMEQTQNIHGAVEGRPVKEDPELPPLPPGFADDTLAFDMAIKPAKKLDGDLWEFDPVEKPLPGILDDEEDMPFFFMPPDKDDAESMLVPPAATPTEGPFKFDSFSKSGRFGRGSPAQSVRGTRQSMWFEMYNLRKQGGSVRSARVMPEQLPSPITGTVVNPLAPRQPFVHRPGFLPAETAPVPPLSPLSPPPPAPSAPAAAPPALGGSFRDAGAAPPALGGSFRDAGAVAGVPLGAGRGIYNPGGSTSFVRDFQRRWLADRARDRGARGPELEPGPKGLDWVNAVEGQAVESPLEPDTLGFEAGTPRSGAVSPRQVTFGVTAQSPLTGPSMPPLSMPPVNAAPNAAPRPPLNASQSLPPFSAGQGMPPFSAGQGMAPLGMPPMRRPAPPQSSLPMPVALDWVQAVELPPTPQPEGEGEGEAGPPTAAAFPGGPPSRAGSGRTSTADSRRRAQDRWQRQTERQMQNASRLGRLSSRASVASRASDLVKQDTAQQLQALTQMQIAKLDEQTERALAGPDRDGAADAAAPAAEAAAPAAEAADSAADPRSVSPQPQLRLEAQLQSPAAAAVPEYHIPMTITGTPRATSAALSQTSSTSGRRRTMRATIEEEDVFPQPPVRAPGSPDTVPGTPDLDLRPPDLKTPEGDPFAPPTPGASGNPLLPPFPSEGTTLANPLPLAAAGTTGDSIEIAPVRRTRSRGSRGDPARPANPLAQPRTPPTRGSGKGAANPLTRLRGRAVTETPPPQGQDPPAGGQPSEAPQDPQS